LSGPSSHPARHLWIRSKPASEIAFRDLVRWPYQADHPLFDYADPQQPVALSSQFRTVGVDGIIGFYLNSRTLPISSMQLDIFSDSRDVMLRNDVLSALQRYDARETQQTLRPLSDEYPDDDSAPQLTVLAGALDLRSTTAFSNHQAAAEARSALVEKTTPAALRMWGEHAGSR
jgi:hypothetical protein